MCSDVLGKARVWLADKREFCCDEFAGAFVSSTFLVRRVFRTSAKFEVVCAEGWFKRARPQHGR